MPNHFLLGLAILTFGLNVAAQATTGARRAEISWRTERLVESHVVEVDGTEVATFAFATRILKDSALEALKQTSVSYSKSAQSFEVLEAYTLKSDGRRIDVPRTNFQVREDSGRGNNNPVYSDLSQTTIVFPEVAPGDAVTLSYRLTTTAPLFPGKISLIGTYPRAYAFDDARVVIDAPSSLKATYEARGMKETVITKDGRKIIEWTLHNREPLKSDRTNFSVYSVEAEPGYFYSTFDSYDDIARSYGSRASQKAVVTERVRKLAEQLTDGKNDPRQQAQALYEWVATHITYAGNCIGIGAVVPRDLNVVLDNLMGDCKDHATLLQALLAAKNIRSHQALLNAANVYRLPDIPVASLVNHVINYIPAFDLFLDSTDSGSPFGMLPPSDEDKPVLMVDGAGLPNRTPPAHPAANRQTMKTSLVINDDGSVEGEVNVSLAGQFGATARRRLKTLSRDDESAFVKGMLRTFGVNGEGTLIRPERDELTDQYKFGVRFTAKDIITFPGVGGFAINPVFYSEAPIIHFARRAIETVEDVDQACSGGTSIEEYEIVLPQSMQVVSMPDSLAFSSSLVAYESSYLLDGRTLKAHRRLEDKTRGNVCSPQTVREYKAQIERVWKSVRQQILFK